jgi:methylase of polypeptide subunit release factors
MTNFSVLSWSSFFLILCNLLQEVVSLSLDDGISSRITELYREARTLRIQRGHAAAQTLYHDLLQRNPWDKTASTYIAASPDAPLRQDMTCRNYDDLESIRQLRILLLDQHQYTNSNIQQVLNVPQQLRYAKCPIYITPLEAGTEKYPPIPQSGLEILISLFLLGSTQPTQLVETLLGPSVLSLWNQLGLAFVDNSNVVVPYVHIFPIALSQHRHILIVTDLHPRILNSIQIGSQQHHHGPVMYVGPDSLALVQHYSMNFVNQDDDNDEMAVETVLDIGTGSGIQALCVEKCKLAYCWDINPRALDFVRFNAALNHREEICCCILGDVISGEYRFLDPIPKMAFVPNTQQKAFLGKGSIDLILANPPFIPVPEHEIHISNRYGLFSSGGPNGESVIEAILKLASGLLRPGGILALVSEFINPNSISLRQRLQDWCPSSRGGILFTNERPLSASAYAKRRAETEEEMVIWERHLSSTCQMEYISPGFLWLQTKRHENVNKLPIRNEIVPYTIQGSIWTPSNENAVEYTQQAWERFVAEN